MWISSYICLLYARNLKGKYFEMLAVKLKFEDTYYTIVQQDVLIVHFITSLFSFLIFLFENEFSDLIFSAIIENTVQLILRILVIL